MTRASTAEALQRGFLQEAQKIALHVERQVAHLVEKQRSALRRLDAPDLALHGAGEGTPLVAEQLGLDERLGNRAAVDGHERTVGARRSLVDGARAELLAGAAFAADEHRRARCGDLADGAKELAHHFARADHLFVVGADRGLRAFDHERHAVRVAGPGVEPLRRDRHRQVIEELMHDEIRQALVDLELGLQQRKPLHAPVARAQHGELVVLIGRKLPAVRPDADANVGRRLEKRIGRVDGGSIDQPPACCAGLIAFDLQRGQTAGQYDDPPLSLLQQAPPSVRPPPNSSKCRYKPDNSS
jgi:hypothetical protein